MQITDIIIILLFIIPGVIADKISGYIDVCDRRKDSEFKELVDGVLASLPIILIIAFFSYRINDFSDSKEFIKAFDDIYYILTFTLWTLVLTVIFGIFKGILGIANFSIVNLLRIKVFNKVAIDNKSCWQNFFNDDGTNQYLVVESENQKLKGFIKWYSLPGEEKGLVLYEPEELELYPEYKEKFNKVKNTYIDIEKNIVIKDYDMSKYNNWINELWEAYDKSTS